MGNIGSVGTAVSHGGVWILIYDRVIPRINNIMLFQIKMSATVISTAGPCCGPAAITPLSGENHTNVRESGPTLSMKRL